jgi:hypothetical protein
MNHIKYLALVCILCGPQIGFAAGKFDHQYTPKEKIVFSPKAMIAFDRSGKSIKHHTRKDGSTMSEHNGSMGNVTVARLGSDGKIETFCTHDAESAKAWMAGEIGIKSAVTPRKPVKVNQP